jgi:hypothetical protein
VACSCEHDDDDFSCLKKLEGCDPTKSGQHDASCWFLICLTLETMKMEATSSSETSISFNGIHRVMSQKILV